MLKWSGALRTMMANVAVEAIADLSDAEIYVGQASTPGMAFVRRYIHEDGSYSGVWTSSDLVSKSKVVGEASERDDTLQIIRFVRKDKKDVIMTNWQAHLASAIDIMQAVVTADLAYYVRDGVEKADDDALVAYFAGASGNINLAAPSHEMRKYRSYVEVGQQLAKIVLETMPVANLKKINAGKINALTSPEFAVDSDSYTQERIDQAKEVLAVASNKTKKLELMKQYGFESDKHINAIANGSTTSHKINLYLGALSFGDLAFVAAPYEMHDNNGVQIKNASKKLGFDTTFVLTCAGGSLGYVASIEACTIYGGYETYQTDVAPGTAEKLVEEYIRMLGVLKSQG